MAELVFAPPSQSMFVDGAMACCGISTVFALTLNLDAMDASQVPWDVVARTGVRAWTLWKESQLAPQDASFCEAYEVLQSVPDLAPLYSGYEIVTGYIYAPMVDAAQANKNVGDLDALKSTDRCHSFVKLVYALTEKLAPGTGGVLVNSGITIGVWRSARTPSTYYVFDSHTAYVDVDQSRRARVLRFSSCEALAGWFLADICELSARLAQHQNVCLTDLDSLSPAVLQLFMYSLTCFVPNRTAAAVAAVGSSSKVYASDSGATAAAAAAAAASHSPRRIAEIQPTCAEWMAAAADATANAAAVVTAPTIIASGPRISSGYRSGGAATASSRPANSAAAGSTKRNLDGSARWVSTGNGGSVGQQVQRSGNNLLARSVNSSANSGWTSCPAYKGLWK